MLHIFGNGCVSSMGIPLPNQCCHWSPHYPRDLLTDFAVRFEGDCQNLFSVRYELHHFSRSPYSKSFVNRPTSTASRLQYLYYFTNYYLFCKNYYSQFSASCLPTNYKASRYYSLWLFRLQCCCHCFWFWRKCFPLGLQVVAQRPCLVLTYKVKDKDLVCDVWRRCTVGQIWKIWKSPIKAQNSNWLRKQSI